MDIAIDLLEIPGGNHLLVVIDYFSRWPEVISVPKTDAHNIIKSMESIFQTHGLPESVRSDNGQPFASAEFGKFLSDLGIVRHKGVPYWPQSNGEVETNKLTPNFEPVPSQVIRKDGNAVIVQSPGGPMRMRNSAHVKKFIPTAVTTGVGDITEAVQPTVATPTHVEPQEAVPTTVSSEVVPVTAPRPGRA